MRKKAFLDRLAKGLYGLPENEIIDRRAFYEEMINDYMEEGLSEDEAVAKIGPIKNVVSQIISETPITTLIKEKVKPTRKLAAWEIVLIVIGSPLWLSLAIALFAVFFSIYIVLWAVIVSLWAVELAIGISAIACLISGFVLLFTGGGIYSLVLIGAFMVLTGITLFLLLGCIYASKGAIKLTKSITIWIKSLFLKKEKQNEISR